MPNGSVRENISVYADGTQPSYRLTRRGELVTVDFVMQSILDGHGFVTNQGSQDTVVDFSVTTYDLERPRFTLRIPSGRTVIPIELNVIPQTEAGTLTKYVWSYSNNDVGAGTSTALTIRSLKPNSGFTSGCNAHSLYTGDYDTAVTNHQDFAKFIRAFTLSDGDPQDQLKLSIYTDPMPVLVGPATLILCQTATTTGATGYTVVKWLEFLTTEVS